MLEVDVGVALLGQEAEAFGEGGDLRRCVAAVAAEAEAGVGGGGVDLGGSEVVAFGDAEGGVVLAQNGVGLFGEAGLVAELKGYGGSSCGAEGGKGEE